MAEAPPVPAAGMEALAAELGALSAEQAAAPVNTVEVSGGRAGAARRMQGTPRAGFTPLG